MRIQTESDLKKLNQKHPASVAGEKGLYAQKSASGVRFVFRYRSRVEDKAHQLPIGEHGRPRDGKVTFAEAKRRAAKYRTMLIEGKDPKAEYEKALNALRQAKAEDSAPTFRECAERYIALQRSGWRNGKHAQQWERTLSTYAYPVIADLPVDKVDDEHLETILEPIWISKHQTATRLRGRIERVLSWATTKKFRSGDNPARWGGHLKELLPAVPKSVKRPKHFSSVHYSELPELVTELRQKPGIGARALEFLILTAARTSEIRFMEWCEIDFDTKIWTIPASRMKMEREHRVPLSSRAIEILNGQRGLHSRWVFPGEWLDRPMSNMTMLMLLRTLKAGVTVHGMRSSFRTWCGERTSYPRLVCEAALAHRNDDAVEDAYLATDYLERRVVLMSEWLSFIEKVPATASVTPIAAAR